MSITNLGTDNILRGLWLGASLAAFTFAPAPPAERPVPPVLQLDNKPRRKKAQWKQEVRCRRR